MMSIMFDDDSGDSSAGGSTRSGKNCDACGEWLDSSDTHCPSCGSER
jgi:predicted amidophosphoribosyltransferase